MAHLFPFHEKVSDYVRACGLPYCDQIFIELLMAVERSVNRTVPARTFASETAC